jgi:hypothetical protein
LDAESDASRLGAVTIAGLKKEGEAVRARSAYPCSIHTHHSLRDHREAHSDTSEDVKLHSTTAQQDDQHIWRVADCRPSLLKGGQGNSKANQGEHTLQQLLVSPVHNGRCMQEKQLLLHTHQKVLLDVVVAQPAEAWQKG